MYDSAIPLRYISNRNAHGCSPKEVNKSINKYYCMTCKSKTLPEEMYKNVHINILFLIAKLSWMDICDAFTKWNTI
jgi:hypothetical protein